MLLDLGRVRRVFFAMSAVFALASAPARAQDASGKAAAEALFESGVELMKAGKFAEACPKLESSQRVDPAVGTTLYLAECYEKLGRTASAWATFREAESLARSSNQADRARTAQQRAQKLEPDLSYLTVNVATDARVEGLVVRRGGAVVLPDLYGVASPVDPGAVEIEASAPGYRSYATNARIAARGKEVVNLPKLEALPASAAPPPVAATVATAPASSTPASQPPKKDTPPEKSPNHTVAYIVGGVGIVGLGVGSYFGLRAMKKNKDAEEFCDAKNVCSDQEALDLTDDAKKAATVSNIAFAVGGAALATGIVLFIVAPGGNEANALRVSPTVAYHGGGLNVAGSFR
jgi:serine/threonine-protein kinase